MKKSIENIQSQFKVEMGIPLSKPVRRHYAQAGSRGPRMEVPTDLLDRLIAKIDCERFYNSDEVAKITGVTRRTIWGQISLGNIPASKFGRSYLIPGGAVVTLLASIREGLTRAEASVNTSHSEGLTPTIVEA